MPSADKDNQRSHLSPHDRYLRGVMVDPRIAHDFLKNNLPPSIQTLIDLDTLELQKDSFINDKLQQRVADLLYAVTIQGKPGYIYLLLEHASKSDRLLPFRMLKYIVEIMDTHLTKTGKTVLPIVYPLILYTGKRPFNFSLNLLDLFEKHKTLARAIYRSPYQLIDLTHASDEELAQYGWFRTAALFSKHIHDVDMLPFLKRAVELLRKLENCGEFRYINLSIRYIMEAVRATNKDALFSTVTQGLQGEYKMMTIAEHLRREGRKEGFKKGIEKGREEGKERGAEEKAILIAKNMLADNVSLETITKFTGVTAKQLKALKH